jgi:hypothetical protein
MVEVLQCGRNWNMMIEKWENYPTLRKWKNITLGRIANGATFIISSTVA